MMEGQNYERLCSQWAAELSTQPVEELLHRVPELQPDGPGRYVLYHFGRPYHYDSATGLVTAADGGHATVLQRLNIYTLLAYCQRDAQPTGQWVPFREVPGAGPYAPAFQRGNLEPFATTFAGHPDALRQAASALGGTPLPESDVGFQLSAFACIPMRFYFWDSDEEFPAQANILFDSGAGRFIHVESLVTLASEALNRLAQTVELPIADT
ncbi:MAG TPA: DUF3786 domain-containing protein [Candidatus Avoscillospira avistercoris]|uniref:DUF3786 domain-containing protein n=1 Tax=Candidatus Avoscillospira avistercoris TaxID=2840707 RepID=A0A9D1JSY7_9FIRM|nr:DUF3786 domain-containing protein [Candidatus Avoscillospira avistercoris]